MSYGPEERKAMMRAFVAKKATAGTLRLANAHHIAATYGPCGIISQAEVEAEMMRHLQEGEGK